MTLQQRQKQLCEQSLHPKPANVNLQGDEKQFELESKDANYAVLHLCIWAWAMDKITLHVIQLLCLEFPP